MVSKITSTFLFATLLATLFWSGALQASPSQAACVTDVAAGGSHTMLVRSNAYGMGRNDLKQAAIAYGNSNLPLRANVGYGGLVEKIVTGTQHSLAIKVDQTLWAWGYNYKGQLGINRTDPSYTRSEVGNGGWKDVAAGNEHSVGVTVDGSLLAWGVGYMLGTGSTSTAAVRAPVLVGVDTDWDIVSAGANHSVALKTDGSLWAWGINLYGQLGDGTVTSSFTPKQVGPLDASWLAISAGYAFTVAIKDDGTLWTWGWDSNGALGLGDQATTHQRIPVQVGTDTDWDKISAGGHHALAIKKNGSLWGWGANSDGQVGDGTYVDKNEPVWIDASGDVHWKDISAGGPGWTINNGGAHSAGIKLDGTVWTWGHNQDGQLGKGLYDNSNIVPEQIMRYVMTPSVDGQGTVSPSTPQVVSCDAAKTFTFTVDDHYHLAYYNGSCDYGSFTDNQDGTWTFLADENRIEESCTVKAKIVIDTYTLVYTAGDHGSIAGSAVQTIDYQSDGVMVSAVPDTGYHFLSWSGGVITASRTDTKVIANLGVTANFTIDTYTVNSSVLGGNGTIDPVDNQTVDYGATPAFSLDSATGYQVGAVTGSCGGSLVNTTFTTSPVTSNCTVVANFALKVPPVISEGDTITVTMSEDADPIAFSLVLNATDANADVLHWSIFSNAGKGVASASGTGDFQTINYTPNQDVNGNDSFAVQVSDGALSDVITVNVTINPVNDAPIIDEAPEIEVTMDEDGNPTAFSLTLNASDADNDILTWSINSDGTIGTATATGTGTTKAIAYVPDQDQYGSDSFVVQLSDGLLSDTITVSVIIYPGNDAPVFTSKEIISFRDGVALVGQITASDVDGDMVTFKLLDSADKDLFALTPAGTLSFNNPPDIKIPLDANADNEYEIIVQADDNTVSATHTSEQSITVKLNGCTFFTIPTGGGGVVVICL